MATSGDIVLYYLLVLLVSGGIEDDIEQIIGIYWALILYHFASALHLKYRYIHISYICLCSVRYTTRFCGDLTAIFFRNYNTPLWYMADIYCLSRKKGSLNMSYQMKNEC